MCSLVPLFKIFLLLNRRWGEWRWWNKKFVFVTLAKSLLFYFLEIITLNFLFCSFVLQNPCLLQQAHWTKKTVARVQWYTLAVMCVILEIIFFLCGFRSSWERGQPRWGSGEGFWADVLSVVPRYLPIRREMLRFVQTSCVLGTFYSFLKPRFWRNLTLIKPVCRLLSGSVLITFPYGFGIF